MKYTKAQHKNDTATHPQAIASAKAKKLRSSDKQSAALHGCDLVPIDKHCFLLCSHSCCCSCCLVQGRGILERSSEKVAKSFCENADHISCYSVVATAKGGGRQFHGSSPDGSSLLPVPI